MFDTMRTMSLQEVKLACLYDFDKRVLTFAEGMEDCDECEDATKHTGGHFYHINCEHMAFESVDGAVPTEFQMR